ncbi:transmembrane and immunoglobulin domain-containing protein 1 [Poecilia reticulata]|uniref:Transmembrane and immunoglobulin domain containing 1 n=1 Tax=Poecilia reticulata TaxID=8081 RepID=A0A3P9PM48_POERE|nr:PREDICTED: transmembrane and immunoglobulin domain-containing protein 1 [Poecilia reticulata]
MKLMISIVLLFLLPSYASQTSVVYIMSSPEPLNGVIQTETEKTVSLVCFLNGTHEDKELVWLRNGAMIKLIDGNKENNSSICINPVIRKDEGATFTCQLKSNSSHSASVTLSVTYHADLSGSEEVTVEEEESLEMQCDMRANPLATSVTWELNGTMVDLSTWGFIITNNGINTKLYVKKVDRSLHEGNYTCTVTSPSYGPLNKTFQVTVTDKTIKFPLMPTIAGVVVVALTALLAIISRRRVIARCFKSNK